MAVKGKQDRQAICSECLPGVCREKSEMKMKKYRGKFGGEEGQVFQWQVWLMSGDESNKWQCFSTLALFLFGKF